MNNQWDFLTSNRFWFLVLGSASSILLDPDFATTPWYVHLGRFISLVSAGFITIRTADRLGEKMGDKPEQITLNELPVIKRRQV